MRLLYKRINILSLFLRQQPKLTILRNQDRKSLPFIELESHLHHEMFVLLKKVS